MNEKVLITKSSMDDIGDAIRGRNGLLTKYLPSEMPTAIESIPNNYTLADEGKVVKNGSLIAQTARATEITANGTYDTTENNSVTVNVSGGGGSVARVSTKSMGGSDASVDVYVDELFVENVFFINVSAGAYKDFGIIRVMYNVPASASPDGVAHTGWCVFALSTCTSVGSTYTANQLILEWPYNRAQTCVAIS